MWNAGRSHDVSRKDDVATIVFVCGNCGVRIHVDDDMRETLIANGCVVCEGAASTADFESVE